MLSMFKKKKKIKIVLLIDDSHTLHDIYSGLVEKHLPNVKLLHAYNGLAGLEIMMDKYEELDLVILDIEMPIMNGLEVLKCVKDDEDLRNLNIVISSAVEKFCDIGDDFKEVIPNIKCIDKMNIYMWFTNWCRNK